jgi:hypothetical protein
MTSVESITTESGRSEGDVLREQPHGSKHKKRRMTKGRSWISTETLNNLRTAWGNELS